MNYNTFSAQMASASAISASALALGIGSLVGGLALVFCLRWMIFKKAGIPGWKAIIPFYSEYMLYEMVWSGKVYLAMIIGQAAVALLTFILALISYGFGLVVGVILAVVVFGACQIATVAVNFKLARSFGQNSWFALGLYFVNIVFYVLLAFGDSKYQGVVEDNIPVPAFIRNFGKNMPRTPKAPKAQPQQPQQQVYQQPYQPQEYQQQPYQQPWQPQEYQQQPYQQPWQPQQAWQQPQQQPYPQDNGQNNTQGW
ncbi:MAG: hypothetical protein IJB69_10355 [Clostridia bacterium]|nr:hypothetical protein [Clostridia bacterium]